MSILESSLSPENEALKHKQLEKGWNNKISIEKESRRSITMSEDIKDFLYASMTPKSTMQELGSPGLGAFSKSLKNSPSHKSKSKNAFDTIANTFGFVHHAGTDQGLELKIIKRIVERESQIMKLVHLCEPKTATNPDGEIVLKPLAGSKILQLLTTIRDTTLDYLDYLQEWRTTAVSATDIRLKDAEEDPKMFIWEGYNYTMKIVSDLDFLADSAALVEALGISANKLRANPLMLPTTLEETADSWMDPALRAAYDCNNQTTGNAFVERLRLRNAERTLLLEIECNAEISTQEMLAEREAGKDASTVGSSHPGSYRGDAAATAILNWHSEARSQANALDPAKADYNAVNGISTKSSHEGRGSPKSKRSPVGNTTHNNQVGNGAWNAQAEIFPESDQMEGVPGLDSGAAFYESFDLAHAQNDQMIPLHLLNQYDSYLSGDNVLSVTGEGQEALADKFGFEDRSERGNQFAGYTDENSVSVSSSATIQNISAYDLELLMGLPNPPIHVQLAGAASVILLSPGNNVPSDVTWQAFQKLISDQSLADRMNAVEPNAISKFKVRAVKPYVSHLLSGNQQLNADVPDDCIEAAERLCKWVHQVVTASDRSKKRKKGGGAQPKLRSNLSVDDVRHDSLQEEAKMQLMGGNPLKDDQGRKITKAQSQKIRAQLLMQGRTVGRMSSPKREESSNTNTSNQDKQGKRSGKGLALKPAELWPVHTEILENTFKHPLLLTVLSSQQEVTPSNSATLKRIKKEMLQYDPLEVAGIPNDPLPERIVVKVYDLVDSQEASVNINVREYTLYLYDIIERYSIDAATFFRPASLLWWVENLRKVVTVTPRVNGKLLLLISKAAIEKTVRQGLNGDHDNSESLARDSITLQSIPSSLGTEQLNNVAEGWDFFGGDMDDDAGDFVEMPAPVDSRQQDNPSSKQASRHESRQNFKEQRETPAALTSSRGGDGRPKSRDVAPNQSSKPPSHPGSRQQNGGSMVMALDYGEDVFEDDGDGEFEAEVARATQMSRTISREKPLSAPGSMSAPQSMSSVLSRHASDPDLQPMATATSAANAASLSKAAMATEEEYLSDEPVAANQSKDHSIASDENAVGGDWEALEGEYDGI